METAEQRYGIFMPLGKSVDKGELCGQSLCKMNIDDFDSAEKATEFIKKHLPCDVTYFILPFYSYRKKFGVAV